MIALRQMLKSGFVDFVAMGDYVNGELALRRINGVEDAANDPRAVCKSLRKRPSMFRVEFDRDARQATEFFRPFFLQQGYPAGQGLQALAG